ncbi:MULTISPECIES: WXG100 family type VII secretion target [unclassified Nocardia]|uniref:WXG100 family type VII secretion target n=1 Tax=unclassified Nocardia TaxID=2637762 RepID=UPI001CE3E48D|nr:MULTISPECIES: WXG100 family type VII secretion target [unclassified Nocardia]
MSSSDGSSYRVDLDHLDQVTAKIGGLLGFLDESLQGIDTRVAALHQQWTGAAAAKHAQAHRDWSAGAAEVREGVETMRAAAQTAHRSYTEVVQTNLRMLGRE